LEKVAADIARDITHELEIPTIGIGSGPHCDGQVQVLHDVLGLYSKSPPFAKQYAALGERAVEAIRTYASEVRTRTFPQ
jgi:3-methyl-2-oxobutanoate hydroxymethyltransferase